VSPSRFWRFTIAVSTNGARALDIARSITHDENLVAAQILVEQSAAALFGNGRDLIAIFVVVGECAGLKQLPKLEAPQLDLGAEPDIAGQQSHDRTIRQPVQLMDEFPHARNHHAVRLREQVVEPENIAVEESPEI